MPSPAAGGNCAAGRLVAATIYQTPGDMSTGVQTAYHYDNRGQTAYTMVHIPKTNGLAPFNGNYLTSMAYDEHGDLTHVIHPTLRVTTGNEDNSANRYASVPAGQCAATPFPAGSTPATTPAADTGSVVAAAEDVSTTYNRIGLAISGTYASAITYNTRDYNVSEIDAQGNLDSQGNLIGTLKRTYTYDNVDTSRLAEVTTAQNSAPPVQDDTFIYDSAGNLFQQHDQTTGTGGGGYQCYTYDGLQRIARSVTSINDCEGGVLNGSNTPNRHYDQSFYYATDDGNRLASITDKTGATKYTSFDNTGTTTQPSAPKTITTKNATLTVINTSTRQYNPFTGELIGRTDTPTGGSSTSYTYGWNDLGQLSTVSQSLGGVTQSSSTNLYDVDGRRLLHTNTANGSTDSTLFVGASEVTATTIGSAVSFKKAKRYYAVGGAPVAVGLFAPSTGKYVSYTGDDRQGSAQMSVDTSNTLNRDAYTPFGSHVGTRTSTSSHDYVGGVLDPDSNLLQMGARYYDADAGVFISPDPMIGATGPTSLNPYAYAGNNPVSGSDPSGLVAIDDNGKPDKAAIAAQAANLNNPTLQASIDQKYHQDAKIEQRAAYVAYIQETSKGPNQPCFSQCQRDQYMANAYLARMKAIRNILRIAHEDGLEIGLTALDVAQYWEYWYSNAEGTVDFDLGAQLQLAAVVPGGGLAGEAAGSAEGRAVTGGAERVYEGQRGEEAVRSKFDIGKKAATEIRPGKWRIFDGLNDEAVSEVKNVRYQALTSQLKDILAWAEDPAHPHRFDLYVRPDTVLSGPLSEAVLDGRINLELIP